MRLALSSVRAGGAPVRTADPVPFVSPWARAAFDQALEIDSSDLTQDECELLKPRALESLARTAPSHQICKVHDAWHDTPAGEPLFSPAVTRGAIYMVRDPRDVAVSYAAFMARSNDDTITAMANAQACLGQTHGQLNTHLRQRLGSWSTHVNGWLNAPVPVLVIRYEDMLAQPAEVIARVTSFLGWTPSASAIAGAVEATKFSKLRDLEARTGFYEKIPTASNFFRQGRSGGWRESLTGDQAEAVARAHAPVMARLGYLATDTVVAQAP